MLQALPFAGRPAAVNLKSTVYHEIPVNSTQTKLRVTEDKPATAALTDFDKTPSSTCAAGQLPLQDALGHDSTIEFRALHDVATPYGAVPPYDVTHPAYMYDAPRMRRFCGTFV
jgi:hypothetical protein